MFHILNLGHDPILKETELLFLINIRGICPPSNFSIGYEADLAISRHKQQAVYHFSNIRISIEERGTLGGSELEKF
jgi:hypothetical protein